MTTTRDIDTTLQRRRFHRLRGVRKFRIELVIDARTTQSAEADTVGAAWNAIVVMAEIFTGTEITSPCPWDEKGNLR